MIEISGGYMDCSLRLFFNRLHHLWMTISGGADSDAGVKIDVAVSVHIPKIRPLGMGNNRRISPGIGLRDESLIPVNQPFTFWAGQASPDFWASIRSHLLSFYLWDSSFQWKLKRKYESEAHTKLSLFLDIYLPKNTSHKSRHLILPPLKPESNLK
jgi:hypothetical protein